MKITKTTKGTIEFDPDDIPTLKNLCEVVRRTMDQAWQDHRVNDLLADLPEGERTNLRHIIYQIAEMWNDTGGYLPPSGGFLPPFKGR